MDILADSNFLLILDQVPQNDDDVFETLSSLPIDMTFLLQMYSFDLNFTNSELLKLIRDLDYLDNKYLNDIILFARYQDPKYFLDNLDECLLPLYHDEKILEEYVWLGISENKNEYKWLKFDKNEINSIEKLIDASYENEADIGESFSKFTYDTTDNPKKLREFVHFIIRGNKLVCNWLLKTQTDNGKENMKRYRNKFFLTACLCGHLTMAKWLYEIYEINVNVFNDACFITACKSGNYDLVVWLYEINDKIDIYSCSHLALFYACTNGHFEIVKFIFKMGNYLSNYAKVNYTEENHSDAFYYTCEKGHFEVVKWMYEINEFEELIDLCSIDASIYSGNLEIIQWMYAKNSSAFYNGIYEKNNPNCIFEKACLENQLEIAKFLNDIYKNENIECTILTFQIVCTKGYFEMAKWLWNVRKPKVDFSKFIVEYLFSLLDLDITIWLWNISEGSINFYTNEQFIKNDLIRQHNNKTLKWIIETIKINDPKILNEMFEKSIMYSNFEMAKYIYGNFDINFKSIKDPAINELIRDGSLEFIEWAYEVTNKFNDICVDPYTMCENAFIRQDIEIVEWVFKNFNIDIQQFFQDNFVDFCGQNNIFALNYLYPKTELTCRINISLAFEMACLRNSFEAAKFLFDLDPNRILSLKSLIHKTLHKCHEKHISLDFFKWLLSLHKLPQVELQIILDNCVSSNNAYIAKWIYNVYNIDIFEGNFKTICMKKRINIARWLYSMENYDINVQKNYGLAQLI